MHFYTETVRVSNLLESPCPLSENSNETETRKHSLDIRLKKYAGGGHIDWFLLVLFLNIMQQEPRREATENNGTLFSLVRKRLGRDRVLAAKEKK